MAGWIRKLSTGRYQARYRAPDGRTRAKTWDRRVDAERWLRSELAKVDRGQWLDPDAGRVTFANWAETVGAGRVHLRDSTRARDESVMRSMVIPTFGPRQIASVTPGDVQGWIASLTAAGYAPSTIRKACELAAAVFGAAIDSDLLSRSPFRGVRLPRIVAPEMRFLTISEVGHLVDKTPERHRAIVLAAAYTGLRFGELAGLRVDRLDLLGRSLTVDATLSEVRGRVSLNEPKTKAARRQVALPRFLCDRLARHIELYPPNDAGLVFVGAEGAPLRRTNFRRRIWLPAVAAAHLDGLRFHELRHTHAAMLIAQGEHPKVIQARLGHASIKTTLDTYGHLFEGLDEAAAQRLDDLSLERIAHETRTEGDGRVFHLDR